ncbi:hypothetical protein CEUSTIGMA_g669.t1 [Chlamydomonas eustigma]|uniref:Protein kinase domain-containing protein n=1 Tax=Chlamydomonas eustigma TaxID=1157962 RepID=A0A250WR95_9CHLO|nr:hypothetical protein CEUSTIGMA_g669.t1 [Chlamydomonas eustigma]|eukprot:GAX73216.1 hypothetical protein CEUSTIGMA_g669.t1 [Chlamydomonas eustigma]
MEGGRVRIRLHWGGKFEPVKNGWQYVGGEVFNESVVAGFKYAELCLKLNEKVGQTTSIKYLAPGEDLSPHELVSISGDDDLKEMYDEYFNAIQRPGTPIKTFRIKIFLFPALQDELDIEHRPLEVFDPNEWCDEEEDYHGMEEEDYEADIYFPTEALICNEPSEEMQWDQFVPQQQQQQQALFMQNIFDRPSVILNNGLFGNCQHLGLDIENLDRHAMVNILQSVSRSHTRMDATEDVDLPNPYHETEDGWGRPSRFRPNKAPDGTPLLTAIEPAVVPTAPPAVGAFHKQEKSMSAYVSPGALYSSPGNNGFTSLAGQFPSHISVFGREEENLGRASALSASADEEGHLEGGDHHHASGLLPAEWPAFVCAANQVLSPEYGAAAKLPSHISIFGNSSHEAMGDLQGRIKYADLVSGRKPFHEAAEMMGRPRTQQQVQVAVDAGHDGFYEPPPLITTPKLLEEVVKVPMEEVRIIRKIGEGAFGEVSYADVESHGLVAIKWLKKDRFAKYSESFMREAEVLAKLNHPNIIRMYGVVIEPQDPVGYTSPHGFDGKDGYQGLSRSGSGGSRGTDQPFIIAGIMTDFVRGGSLSGQLRAARRRPTLKERCQIAVQAGRGMAYLHAQNPAVIHFDLKPDNLLVDGDGENLHVKVADFGLSKHKFQSFVSCRDLRGTLPYMAPELVSNPHRVSERCDVWSMGVVMWEMYTLEVPYSDMTAQQILAALMDGSIHLHIPNSCEPEWRGLIETCLDPNPEARPSFKQLTTHLDALLRQLG